MGVGKPTAISSVGIDMPDEVSRVGGLHPPPAT